MQTFAKDTQEAPVKWWAARDAQQRNTANKMLWSTSTHLKVEQMKMVMGLLYTGKVYEAYGKRQVTVKVERATVKDKRMLAEMEADWAKQGIVKTVTQQGVLYKVA